MFIFILLVIFMVVWFSCMDLLNWIGDIVVVCLNLWWKIVWFMLVCVVILLIVIGFFKCVDRKLIVWVILLLILKICCVDRFVGFFNIE